MKRYRLLHLAILLFFAGVIVGVQFHSHAPGQDLLTAHCKSCQVSQAPYDFVSANVISISEIAIPYQAPTILFSANFELHEVRLGRAPPSC